MKTTIKNLGLIPISELDERIAQLEPYKSTEELISAYNALLQIKELIIPAEKLAEIAYVEGSYTSGGMTKKEFLNSEIELL